MYRKLVRAGLVVLAVSQGLVGAVQLLLPRRFYDDFPSAGHPWVALLPPYNEHLMRDVGATTLAYVLVLAVAAVTMEPLLIRTALAANVVFTVPHLVFHATHLTHFSTGDAIGQTVALAVGVVIPAALLLVPARQLGRPTEAPGMVAGMDDRGISRP